MVAQLLSSGLLQLLKLLSMREGELLINVFGGGGELVGTGLSSLLWSSRQNCLGCRS